MNKIITIYLCFLSLISCVNKEVTDISNYLIVSISYTELPSEIRKLLDEKINEVVESYDDLAYSTDKKVTFKHYRKKTNNWLEEVNNNDDYFVVDSKTYRKQGNNGSPYIYHKGSIYYCEYNLNMNNYKNKKYYKIYLKK